ncbi:FIG00899144: hypothetical protein [hydrothermal vent metagenome]|uniref:Uncharacterized protein n=1 Tax=hydrothermal vent metagenome TaxID=652676 RepID=A0A3B1C6T2_9ZZZZ
MHRRNLLGNMKIRLALISISFIFLIQQGCRENDDLHILDISTLSPYIEIFNQNDNELYIQHIPNDSALTFLSDNIPLIDLPDKDIEETYYFRWWTFRKHIKKTEDGFVITEFLPKVPWSGKYNTINCPAGHHIYEGRWLRNPKYIQDYIDFWLTKSGDGIRKYSFWAADAVLAFNKVHRNYELLSQQLPLLINNYKEWERIRRDSTNILFWQLDGYDGMEVSVSGRILNKGIPIGGMEAVRPTINSYMYGDAKAISTIADLTNQKLIAQEFSAKALLIKQEVQNRLWNEKLDFFTVLPKKYSDADKPLDVRELIGYVPWYFNLPDDKEEYSAAWNKVTDTTGFYAPYGLTVCERSHPYFEISYTGHECQWNGPSWPFATTQTLKGMSNLLNYYSNHGNISKDDYFKLLLQYAKSQSIVNEEGNRQKWIDENLNPFTGDWISRTILKTSTNGTWSGKKGRIERGKDYNHSGFCDLVISDLLGLKPRIDNTLEINPLIPNKWDWFCLDRVSYHGFELTIIWDKTGDKYKKGKGLMVFVNGKLKAKTNRIERLLCEL